MKHAIDDLRNRPCTGIFARTLDENVRTQIVNAEQLFQFECYFHSALAIEAIIAVHRFVAVLELWYFTPTPLQGHPYGPANCVSDFLLVQVILLGGTKIVPVGKIFVKE